MAVTDPGRGAHGISAFMVEKSDPGVSFGALEKKLGIKGSPTRTVIFEDARIPADRIVGEEGTAFRTALATLDHTRITIAARRWASPRAAWTTPPGTCGGVSSSASRWPQPSASTLAKLAPPPGRGSMSSIRLGHADPKSTYWYLSASPELLALAAERLEIPPRTRS